MSQDKVVAYIRAALQSAWFERLEDGTCYGEMPALRGVWAQAQDRAECQRKLVEVALDWLQLKAAEGDALPTVDGLELTASDLARAGDGFGHRFMWGDGLALAVTDDDDEEISEKVLDHILRQAGMSREEWDRAGEQ